MKSFNKVIWLGLFLIATLFAGCNLISTKNLLPESKPKDFNFIFNYGIFAKNQLDTINGQYTKDMVHEPSVSTNLKLSSEEMDTIYSEMKKINILDYPDKFNPKSKKVQTPFDTYSIKIIIEDKEKSIYWEDENVSESKEAVQLRRLFVKIQEIIESKDEYKKLPKAKGGYE